MSTSLKVKREEKQYQRGARGTDNASVTKAEQLPPAPSSLIPAVNPPPRPLARTASFTSQS